MDFVVANGKLETLITTSVVSDLAQEPLFDIDDERFETVISGIMSDLPDALGGDAGGEPEPGLLNPVMVLDGPNQDFLSFYGDLQ